jgi:hypothetical protein
VKTLALLKNQDQEDFCARKQMKKTGNYCSKTILELEENQKNQQHCLFQGRLRRKS